MNGILILNKPSDISSAKAVARVKRLLPRGIKIGHAGTLDPFATGVLLLMLGRATKLSEKMMDQPKQYVATVMLGATTATDDPESVPQPWSGLTFGAPPLQISNIEHTLPSFIGQIFQTPPIFSAMKIGGRRAYALARAGGSPVMTPRVVNVYGIDLLEYAWPTLNIRVDCGRGTYIRALARDIGAALNVGGYLTQLCRTRIGPFSLDSAVSIAELTPDLIAERMIPLDEVKSLIEQHCSNRVE